MDGFTLVAHIIWASVVAGFVAAYWFYVFSRRNKSFLLSQVSNLKTSAESAHHAINSLDEEWHRLSKEVAQIRDGLEKLKAIPPKQPRL